jgi:AcrR family transcriptional regulator
MAVRPRREEHKELTRQAVVDTAALRFVAEGFAATTIDEIARAARVSKGAVYYHFADKAALFEAVLRDRLAHLRDVVDRVSARRRDPWDRLDAALGAYVQVVAGDAELRSLIAQAPLALGPRRCAEVDEEAGLSVVLEVIGRLQADGRLHRQGAPMLARVLLAAAREAAISAARSADPAAARREASAALTAFTRGLRHTQAGRTSGSQAGRS